MSRNSLKIIQKEHSSLASLLHALRELLEQGPGEDREGFFKMLRTILFYLDDYPERLHHPKETQMLFPMVQEAVPKLAEVIEKLDQDHAYTYDTARQLQHQLLAWELLGDSRREEFLTATHQFIGRYLMHIMVEEQKIIPAAEQHLSDEQWEKLDALFETNCDPLTGMYAPRPEYLELFQRITQLAAELHLKLD